jgi:hypothetical protein
MMDVSKMTLEEIREAGMQVLTRELGPVGMIRFMQQFETGSGDYSAERHKWLDGMSIEAIVEKIRLERTNISKE